MREEGLVGMCTVKNCIYNMESQCHASTIQVALKQNHADCETFKPK